MSSNFRYGIYAIIQEENYTGAGADVKAWDIPNKYRTEDWDSSLLRISPSEGAPRSITATSCPYHQAAFYYGPTLPVWGTGPAPCPPWITWIAADSSGAGCWHCKLVCRKQFRNLGWFAPYYNCDRRLWDRQGLKKYFRWFVFLLVLVCFPLSMVNLGFCSIRKHC